MGLIEKAKIFVGKATDALSNLKDKFTASVQKVQGYLGSQFEAAANGSTFAGINYGSIDKIRSAIRTYVTKIQNELAKINSDLSPDKALKGDIAPAASAYVKAVTDVAEAYVSALLAYSDKMYEYGEAYKSSDTNVSSSLNEEASAMSATAGETYVEKY